MQRSRQLADKRNKSKMKKGRKFSKISLRVLKAVGEFGVETINLMTTIPSDQFVAGGRVHYRRAYDLKRRGYLAVKKDKKNRSFFHLTPKGKLRLLKYLHLEKLRKGKWDGHWRVIIFDIPESLKKWREYLRKDLRNLGFQQLQRSVYITPYPVTGELHQILEEWNLRKYFRYLTVSEIDGADKLKKQFKLK